MRQAIAKKVKIDGFGEMSTHSTIAISDMKFTKFGDHVGESLVVWHFFPIVDILFQTLDICRQSLTSVPKEVYVPVFAPVKVLNSYETSDQKFQITLTFELAWKFGRDPFTDLRLCVEKKKKE